MTRHAPHVLYAAILMALIPLAGCGDVVCPLVYIDNGISVEFSEPLTTSGSYTLSTTTDGRESLCELILVDSRAGNDCIDGVCHTVIRPLDSNDCDWATSSLSDDSGTLDTLRLGYLNGTPPGTFDIRIEREGALIGEGSYTLQHDAYRPHGPSCGEYYDTTISLTTANP